MGDEPVSSASRWSETDKLKTFFDIIEASGPTDWNKVPVPEGRTLKAIKSMVDNERARLRKALEANGSATENGEGATAAAPKRKRAPAKKKEGNEENGTAETNGDGQPAATKRKRAPPKKKEQGNDENGEGADGGEDKPAVPKRKRAPPKKKQEKGDEDGEGANKPKEAKKVKNEPKEDPKMPDDVPMAEPGSGDTIEVAQEESESESV